LNGVSYNATITQQNYSSISTLLTALNASIVTAITSTGFTFVLSVNTANNIIITSTGAFSSYSIIQSTLSNILNINSAINQIAGTYTSPFIYNLGYDLYIQMSFFNVPSIFSSQGNVPSSLKIPLNTNAYNILYYSTDSENKTIGVGLKTEHGIRLAYLAKNFAIGQADMKELTSKPAAKCPENNKQIPLISQKGSACVSCSLCVYSKADIVFSATKK
jgi:hypothetical protein